MCGFNICQFIFPGVIVRLLSVPFLVYIFLLKSEELFSTFTLLPSHFAEFTTNGCTLASYTTRDFLDFIFFLAIVACPFQLFCLFLLIDLQKQIGAAKFDLLSLCCNLASLIVSSVVGLFASCPFIFLISLKLSDQFSFALFAAFCSFCFCVGFCGCLSFAFLLLIVLYVCLLAIPLFP